MISDAGGNSSSAAGVDDEDVVTLSENKRIERLYLKSILRESVKNIKKEIVKKKLKKSLISAFLFEDVDIVELQSIYTPDNGYAKQNNLTPGKSIELIFFMNQHLNYNYLLNEL